jgi:hypothetical protein
MTNAIYDIHKVIENSVFIIDRSDDFGSMSVTNDSVAVCARLHALYPGYRFFYRDTMGNWDELIHVNGVWRGWKPARDLAKGLDL